MPIKFDASKYAIQLSKAGIPQDQADAHAQALCTALNDLVMHRSDAEARIETLHSELNSMFDTLWANMNSRFDALWAALHSV